MLRILAILALAGPALAQWDATGFQQQPRQYQQVNTCPGGGKSGTLRVTGANEQSAKADQASVDLSINVARANSSSEASNSTMDAAAAVINALTTEPNAVAQDDITTQYVNLSPDSYGSSRGGNTTFSYTMRLTVKVVNVTNEVLADVLSSASKAGGKSLSIQSIKFSLSESRRTELKRKAQKLAVVQAKDKALRLSKELGVSISHIINVQDDPSTRFLPADQRNEAADPVGAGKQPVESRPAGPKPTGLAVGTEYIKSTMRITYGICNPTARVTPMDAAPAPTSP